METVVEIEPTIKALYQEIEADLSQFGFKFSPSDIIINPYGYDDRIGWNAYIVTINNYGVYGFTNGPLDRADDKNTEE